MFKFSLGTNGRLSRGTVASIWLRLSRMGAADLYLMPDLWLAGQAVGAEPPIDSNGLAGAHLGRFTAGLTIEELAEELQGSIDAECPAGQLAPEEVTEAEPVLSEITEEGGKLSRVVSFAGHTGTIKAVGARLGIPRTTLLMRLQRWPDIPLELLLSQSPVCTSSQRKNQQTGG